jgi:hypothetical protein
MIWEYIIVGAAVATALLFILRKYYKTLAGKETCCEDCKLHDTCTIDGHDITNCTDSLSKFNNP